MFGLVKETSDVCGLHCGNRVAFDSPGGDIELTLLHSELIFDQHLDYFPQVI
jgi:hypothetical protein